MDSFTIAEQPINKSKSLIILPDCLKRAFSLPYFKIAFEIGNTVIWLVKVSINLWFFTGLELFCFQHQKRVLQV